MQANKAGLLEIADIFVINKADRPGVREARRDLEGMLDLSILGDWRPPIVETIAQDNSGVEELWATVAAHRAHLLTTGEIEERRAKRLAELLRRTIAASLADRVEQVADGSLFDEQVARLVAGQIDPYEASGILLEG